MNRSHGRNIRLLTQAVTAAFALVGGTSLALAADINTGSIGQNGWFADDTRADGSGAQPAGSNLRSPTLTDAPENMGANPAHDAGILNQILMIPAPGTVPVSTWTGSVNLRINNIGLANGKSTISHRKDDGIGHAPGAAFADPGFSAVYSWIDNNMPANINYGAALKIGIKTGEFGLAGVSLRTGENSWDKLLVYEPYRNLSYANGTWKTETVSFTTGKWWIVDRTGGGNSQNTPLELSAMASSGTLTQNTGSPRTIASLWAAITAPGAHITNIQFGIGSGNGGANVYVNQFAASFYRAGDVTTFGPPPPPPPSLTLDATSNCYDVGQTITVHINAANLPTAVQGGQFFLNFDPTKLQFMSASPGGIGNPTNPYDFEFYECVGETIMGLCTPIPGRLDYSVGVDPFAPPSGSAANNTMAVLQFQALAEVCNVGNLIQFRDTVSGPLVIPTRLTAVVGGNLFPGLVNLEPLTIDSTNPVLACPANTTIQCTTPPTPANTGQATATDNCGTPTVNYTDFTVNTFASPAGWAYRTENTATGALVTGPGSPPSGVGSFTMPTGAGLGAGQGGKTYLFTSIYDNLPLNSLNEFTYWTYISNNGGSELAPSINLYVDWDNNGTRDTTLVWEPIYATSQNFGNVITGSWQQWNALSNDDAWWYTANFGTLQNGGGGIYRPLSYYLAQYPNAKIVNWVGLPGVTFVTGQASGAGWVNFVGNVDMVEINSNNYDFEPNNLCGQQIFRFWSAVDGCGNTSACPPQVINVVDTTAPVFVNACPLPTINVNSAAGTCGASGATVNPVTPTATDNCSMAEVTFVRSDGALSLTDPYLAANSPITITWTAMDACNNAITCTQTVNVSSLVAMNVTVELSPALDNVGSLTRCITFEGWVCAGSPPQFIVSQEVNFVITPGLALGSTTILVPCQFAYTCVTARDDLHTLRRTDSSITTVGLSYAAEFTGNPNSGGDWLVGGNLNDDLYIDILDFGVYIGEFGDNYGNGNTNCLTAFPHADITGNGTVGYPDFTFIQINFLKLSEANCCGNLNDERALAIGPVTRISVKELHRRGMSQLIRADLNRDGWLDTQDVSTYLHQGAAGGQP